MPIIKRNFNNPAHYLADFNSTIRGVQQSLIKAYLRSVHCALLAWIVVGTSIVITGNVSADTDTATASHQKMLTLLKGIADQTAETNNYIGDRAGTFSDQTEQAGLIGVYGGLNLLQGDYDNDGDQDIFEQIGGAFPGNGYSNVLYENPGLGGHFLTMFASGGSDSSDFASYYNRGLDLSKGENYLGAVESLKKAIQIDPNRVEPHRLLGRVYLLYLAKTTEAIESFQTAIKLDSENPTVHQLLGVAYFRRNQYPEAIQALRQAIELNPEVTPDYPYHPYYDLGLVYLKQAKFDDAIICFEKAIELDPDQIRAYYSLGNTYIRQGTVQKGVELIRKYQNLKPYMNLVSQLEIAIQQNPDNPERWHQLGRVHVQYGRFEKAITSLEQSIKLNPNNWEVYNVLAVCHMRLNQLDNMQRVCETAVRLAPDEPYTHNTLGMNLFLQRRYSDATQSFTTAIRLDPHNPEFHENLGETYKRLGEGKKAAQEFSIAQQLRAK